MHQPVHYDVVVNATSASLRGELPLVPASVFRRASLAYELAYGNGLTPFLRLARDAGVERASATALACWWSKAPKP